MPFCKQAKPRQKKRTNASKCWKSTYITSVISRSDEDFNFHSLANILGATTTNLICPTTLGRPPRFDQHTHAWYDNTSWKITYTRSRRTNQSLLKESLTLCLLACYASWPSFCAALGGQGFWDLCHERETLDVNVPLGTLPSFADGRWIVGHLVE